jgi:aldehyde:ferredoxin oxidoreductase
MGRPNYGLPAILGVKTTHETDAVLRAETHANARIACIGPAGENQVLFAAIMNEKDRAAGRAGVGAVMGSKKLKAIVVKGDDGIKLKDEAGFKAANQKYLKKFKDSLDGGKSSLNVDGTAATITGTQATGCLPTRNCQQGTFENWEAIGGETLSRNFLLHAKACYSCPIGCGRVTQVKDPEFKGRGEGPEYETIYSMGSMCGIDNLAALTKANYLCNELGMDTISMGATLACAMEMAERGYLPETDVGRPLTFGDAHALVELTRQTAHREGFGEQLAQGSLRLATQYDHPELAMVSKGLEFAGYDPRGEQGMGLAYATSPIGASHMRGDPAYIEILGVPMSIDPKNLGRQSPAGQKLAGCLCGYRCRRVMCLFFGEKPLHTHQGHPSGRHHGTVERRHRCKLHHRGTGQGGRTNIQCGKSVSGKSGFLPQG